MSIKNSRLLSKYDLWFEPNINTPLQLHIACGTLVALHPENSTSLVNVIECDLVTGSPEDKIGKNLFLKSVDIRIRSDLIKIFIPVIKIANESEMHVT
ncbi:MAG: hypothetical protein ACTSV2_02045 [Candidatus Thorarchaeota archaeon]